MSSLSIADEDKDLSKDNAELRHDGKAATQNCGELQDMETSEKPSLPRGDGQTVWLLRTKTNAQARALENVYAAS